MTPARRLSSWGYSLDVVLIIVGRGPPTLPIPRYETLLYPQAADTTIDSDFTQP